ncbi:hypothetical protein [Polycyclovorans algicola]|uniref:hypothetical protein n=1 Tax=Polycyclovorans algicola TaxID=616992 RepID=UPI001268CF09|nr:hypothetical protein [Polycyclovorans algicola]
MRLYRGMGGVALLLAVGMAHGHGAEFRSLPDVDALSLRFGYSVGEPMADTDVRVVAPDDTLWQQGRTDGAGTFSFLPDRAGRWQVIADDGLGHEVMADLDVSADGAAAAGQAPTVIRVPPLLLFGLLLASLVVNGLLIWRRLAR